jgi:hypothetical protein
MKNTCLLLLLLGIIPIKVHAQDALVVGSGGGITGQAAAYKVLADGKVYKGKGVADIQYPECAKIRKSKAKKLLKRAGRVQSTAGALNAPGNLYYFLAIQQDGKENRITWGAADQPAPEAVKVLYQDVQSMVTGLKYKPIP